MSDKRKGYDAESFGLIKRDYNNTDSRYVAMKNIGGITEYALKPQHFTRTGTRFLHDIFDVERRDLETQVYVDSIQVKGFLSHSDYHMMTEEYCPVVLTNNPFSGRSPYNYARDLEAGDVSEYGMYNLNYGATINPFSIDIRNLPNIDLTADADITVSVGSQTATKPLTHLINNADRVAPTVTVAPSVSTADGFTFYWDFAGTNFTDIYSSGMSQVAIVDGLTQHMMQNGEQEAAFGSSEIFTTAMSLLGSVRDFNLVGGIGSGLDAFMRYGLRDASFSDMSKQANNIGGKIRHNAVGESLDSLVMITYPIAKTVDTGANGIITPGEFERHKLKTFEIHQAFDDIVQAYQFIDNNYGLSETVSVNVELMVEYGEYNKYFQRMLKFGGISL